MTKKVKEKAKRATKAKRPKYILKSTTIRMLCWAYHLRSLTPYGRASYAQNYRDARKNGCTNRYIMGIDKYPTPEHKKRAEELEAEDAALAAQDPENEPSPDTTADEADTAPHVDLQDLQGQASVTDEHDPTTSHAPAPRRRRSRAVPQARQAEFSFGSD